MGHVYKILIKQLKHLNVNFKYLFKTLNRLHEAKCVLTTKEIYITVEQANDA